MKARINTQKVENLPPKNQISLKSSLERLGGIIKNRVKKKPKKLLIVLILLGPALIAVTIYTVAVRISGVSKPDISPEQTTPHLYPNQ